MNSLLTVGASLGMMAATQLEDNRNLVASAKDYLHQFLRRSDAEKVTA